MNQFALDPKTALLDELRKHIGAERGVKAKELAQAVGLSEREVRHQVSALRDEGIAVCGHPSSGYFIAANAEELEATCDYLHERAMHSLRLISRLKRIPMQDLIGQLKLKT